MNAGINFIVLEILLPLFSHDLPFAMAYVNKYCIVNEFKGTKLQPVENIVVKRRVSENTREHNYKTSIRRKKEEMLVSIMYMMLRATSIDGRAFNLNELEPHVS